MLTRAAGALRTPRQHHGPDGPVEQGEIRFAVEVLVGLSAPWPLLDEILPALWAVTTRERYRESAAVAGGTVVDVDVELIGRDPRQLSLERAVSEDGIATG